MTYGLYVHFPWCITRCPYCDFNAHVLKASSMSEDAYITLLIHELDRWLKVIDQRPLCSIYIGGGTPSLLSAYAIERLLHAIAKRFGALPHEITLEANPSTVEAQRFKDYQHAGITRLSLGVQTFNTAMLLAIGRQHTVDAIWHAIDALHRIDWKNFNIDLMYALPGQTIDQVQYDIQQTLQAQPTHVSWYHFTIEPGTAFFKNPPILPSDEDVWYMQQQGLQDLVQANWHPYEITAFTQNMPCQHNQHYWQFGDYLGIGAGAHGKITKLDGSIWRYANPNVPRVYATQRPNITCNTPADTLIDFVISRFRLYQPITWITFERSTHLPRDALKKPLSQGVSKGWITLTDDGFLITEEGHRWLSDIMSWWLPSTT
jgi:putative oxygen-independent coproporphyrinogen III oxidase